MLVTDKMWQNVTKCDKIEFKNICIEFEENTESDLIQTCLNNNHDFNMINKLNLVTYAGPLYDVNNIN